MIWGRVEGLPGTSDDYAIPFPREVHPAFRSMKDSVMVVSDREKEVSSRAGHALMESHPYAAQRYRMAAGNMLDLIRALQEGDRDAFIRITEVEALNLHALMMSSDPSYLLIEPNTLNIVNSVRRFRKENNVPVCFTLDAGPNVHIIYPAENDKEVKKLIVNELALYCKNGRWIDDEMGMGPEKLE